MLQWVACPPPGHLELLVVLATAEASVAATASLLLLILHQRPYWQNLTGPCWPRILRTVVCTPPTDDETVGWYQLLHGRESEQALGVGWGSLACCSPWGHKESDTTELNRASAIQSKA